jgi:hypothetical protein
MTLDVYSGLYPDDVDELMERLERAHAAALVEVWPTVAPLWPSCREATADMPANHGKHVNTWAADCFVDKRTAHQEGDRGSSAEGMDNRTLCRPLGAMVSHRSRRR